MAACYMSHTLFNLAKRESKSRPGATNASSVAPGRQHHPCEAGHSREFTHPPTKPPSSSTGSVATVELFFKSEYFLWSGSIDPTDASVPARFLFHGACAASTRGVKLALLHDTWNPPSQHTPAPKGITPQPASAPAKGSRPPSRAQILKEQVLP